MNNMHRIIAIPSHPTPGVISQTQTQPRPTITIPILSGPELPAESLSFLQQMNAHPIRFITRCCLPPIPQPVANVMSRALQKPLVRIASYMGGTLTATLIVAEVSLAIAGVDVSAVDMFAGLATAGAVFTPIMYLAIKWEVI